MGREFPRRFLPDHLELDSWHVIAPYFEALRVSQPDSAAALEDWLLKYSELSACVSEERGRRYIAFSRNTADASTRERYTQFLEQIDPSVKSAVQLLDRKLIERADALGFSTARYQVLLRNVRADLRTFKEENIPLQTRCSALENEYQETLGAMTVNLEGRELTMAELGPYYENPDRTVRERIWKLEAARRLADRAKLDHLFSELVQLRHAIAVNAGFSNYLEFAFVQLRRFDYSPQDCETFHAALESQVVPLTRAAQDRRRQLLGIDTLRPWDHWWPWYYGLDPEGRPALKPVEDGAALLEGCLRVLERVDSELRQQLCEMRDRGDLDLDARKGKAPGAYSYCLDEVRRPFIFMNSAGIQKDVETLLHEAGHSFHSLACRSEPLIEYRSAPIEFCEVASMTMELFGSEFFEQFYTPQDASRARMRMLEGIIEFLRWAPQIDAFQHWIYTNPGHSSADRNAKWIELDRRFSPQFAWDGFEDFRASYWQRQTHLFTSPFYYIEYAIAQLGALQIWLNFKQRGREAVNSYKEALALGGSVALPQLFEAAGARFDFSAECLQRLVGALASAVLKMNRHENGCES
ncbi:MAG: M3 family oligoendopeptidase [Oligoflexia bacterium]|nr:M3 family oligoendopeptidase [Oligoflexia bacterium]